MSRYLSRKDVMVLLGEYCSLEPPEDSDVEIKKTVKPKAWKKYKSRKSYWLKPKKNNNLESN